jgi:hypothetical protein
VLAGSSGMSVLFSGDMDDGYLGFTLPFSFSVFNVRKMRRRCRRRAVDAAVHAPPH